MNRYLFVVKVIKDDGVSSSTMYRSYEAYCKAEALIMLATELSKRNLTYYIKRVYIEI